MGKKNKVKRYIITAHTPGLRANRRLLDTISHMCEVFEAELLTVLTKSLRTDSAVDEWIDEESIIYKSRQLNSNLKLIPDRIAITTSDDPTSQYLTEAGKTCSLIIGSPKRFQKPVARAYGIPRYIITSLSVDHADQLCDTKNERKSAQLHTQGCLLVEIVDDNIYFAHQLEAEKDGSVIFNSLRFYPNGNIKTEYAEAVNFGDSHLDHIDTKAEEAAFEIVKEIKPKFIIEEDAFNGSSINHHEENNHLSSMNWSSLEEEAVFTAKKLAEHVMLAKKHSPRFKKLILKDSNHHDFLDRYVQNFHRWMNDNQNKKLALELAYKMSQGNHGLETLLRKYSPLKEVQFLEVGETCEIAGVDNTHHGDKGANGAKGSAKQFMRALKKANVGHTHAPGVDDTVFNSGTLSILRPQFAAKGLTSWGHAATATYPSSSRQLYRIIDGKWRGELSDRIKRSIKRRLIK